MGRKIPVGQEGIVMLITILSLLLDVVIIKPQNNKKDILRKETARIKRNPLLILTNKVNRIR
jgi:hypothetical protein